MAYLNTLMDPTDCQRPAMRTWPSVISLAMRVCAFAAFMVAGTTPVAHAFKQEDIDRLEKTNTCIECDLSGISWIGARLTGADLYGANLSGANFGTAELSKANLTSANLIGTNLSGANLSDASLIGAKLRGTNLVLADLSGTHLSGARETGADLDGAVFEPRENKLPDLASIRLANNLHLMRYIDDPDALVALRKSFKEAGRTDLQRQITHAIKRSERLKAPWFESALTYVFFELTSQWGMSPGRPLLIMIGLMFLFTGLYVKGLKAVGKDGIWMVWAEDRILKNEGAPEPQRVDVGHWSIYLWAFYFSILSSFYIGWRELNLGSWISRMQSGEYNLRATGWVRTVSGLQSLLSVYLVALTVLTYFGHPFE